MGLLDGKVAFITGAARGQGRSHAVRLAQEGADIIAVDICAQIPTVQVPMSTTADLEETRRLVEAEGRRIVTAVGDVRDRAKLADIARDGVGQLGRLDIVVANAGIFSIHNPISTDPDVQDAVWRDQIDVNLTGVWNTLRATVPILIEAGEGGAIVLTSSTAGVHSLSLDDYGQDAYVAAKHGVVGLMRNMAVELAKHNIRVNTVNPTVVSTPMVVNPVVDEYVENRRLKLAVPDAEGNLIAPEGYVDNQHVLPVDAVEAIDVSNAVLYLVSDMGRYVTGSTLPVDAGLLVR